MPGKHGLRIKRGAIIAALPLNMNRARSLALRTLTDDRPDDRRQDDRR